MECANVVLPEPAPVYPEASFQKAVVAVIQDVLKGSGQNYFLLEGFGLDVVVFREASPSNLIRMFEVKADGGQRSGGVGFGNQRGQGSQVELLLCDNKSLLLFDGIIRWVYADSTKPSGSQRYAMFTCTKAKSSAMGGVARGKQNNLRTSALEDCLLDWQGLCGEIGRFLVTQGK